MLWLLMLSNDNGVGRLFFALGVEAIAPAVVATMEVEVAEEEDDNNKGWMAVVAVAESATVEVVAVAETTEERWSGTSGDRGIPKRL